MRKHQLLLLFVYALSVPLAMPPRSVAEPQVQEGPVGKLDPERCDECRVKTLPLPKWDIHGGLRWYSDADAIDPARADPTSDPHCFVRSVENRSANRADYKWKVGGLENSSFEPRMINRRCSGGGGVGNPPAEGPILVNLIKPDGGTAVWPDVSAKQSAALNQEVFPELWTTLDTQLYRADKSVEPLTLSASSRVERAGDRFQYSYVLTRRSGGTAPYILAWTPAESQGFIQELRNRGLFPLNISKLASPSLTITFGANRPPRRIEGPLKLSQIGGNHILTVDVSTWVPQNPQ
jgi:hypothetical protein